MICFRTYVGYRISLDGCVVILVIYFIFLFNFFLSLFPSERVPSQQQQQQQQQQ
jgi:hypothetical protein